MKRTFFARFSLLILAVVFFLAPFALRGARMSLQRMKNQVKDWLPSHFPETKELAWFGRHFVGEQFIIMTWPGCTERDPRFQLMVEKLRGEIEPRPGHAPAKPTDPPSAAEGGDLPEPGAGSDRGAEERERARRIGDKYGLFATGDYHRNWGGHQEKWLLGDNGMWYFITPKGGVYRWRCDGNVLGYARRWARRLLGESLNNAELIDTVGAWGHDSRENEFYRDPRKLTGRQFSSVRTGPSVLEGLARPGGALWPRGDIAEADKPRLAREAALDRLTGALFGPAVPAWFRWTVADFERYVPEETRRRLPAGWQATLTNFVDRLVREEYDGDPAALWDTDPSEQSKHWRELFAQLGCPPPPRQTCIMVTLSEVGKRNLHRSVGRPILGKPPGQLLQLASHECGISADDLKLGGPPVDNVAIDEEGTKTLLRLIVYSAVVGITLAYLCFRSVWVTMMVFFVGGLSALASLSFVWWGGSMVDAIVLSMPALVYVLGLSGAVHIVNYYREAAWEKGLEGAPETALAHGWFPCTLAAFTTSLGLLSLNTSYIAPIRRFGTFSALGVMATLILLFTYLPAALQLYPPGYHKQRDASGQVSHSLLHRLISKFWNRVGEWVIRRHAFVTVTTLILLVVTGYGLTKIKTSIQLLKLFDGDAKLIQDYTWLEGHLGKLVPMELVVCFNSDLIRPPLDELRSEAASESDRNREKFQFSFLERMEAAARVRTAVEHVFGRSGHDVIGCGMSADTFAPPLPGPTSATRVVYNLKLERSRDEYLHSDYLRVDQEDQRELWRVSLRLAALKDVDYGEFVSELKRAVEPVMSAYRCRNHLLRALDQRREGGGLSNASVLVLGCDPKHRTPPPAAAEAADPDADSPRIEVDQADIFAGTLDTLLKNRGFRRSASARNVIAWHDPEGTTRQEATSDDWAAALARFDCVVLAGDDPAYDQAFIRRHARFVIDARDYRFDPEAPGAQTAAQRRRAGDEDAGVAVVYTGLVPIVYKAQWALFNSLVSSIALAFVMITLVMMVLLRRWKDPWRPSNTVNFAGGLASMLPNVFPMVLIFGVMGHLGILVDIGSMMTASVAMGVAVDDTIHFLNWFRYGLDQGLERRAAIRLAYQRVASAMTQTTAIGGLGLFVFALSTFTPTQRFGILMLTLLSAALIGDLILLPALLAGPLGRFFETRKGAGRAPVSPLAADESAASVPGPLEKPSHGAVKGKEAAAASILRRDAGGRPLRP